MARITGIYLQTCIIIKQVNGTRQYDMKGQHFTCYSKLSPIRREMLSNIPFALHKANITVNALYIGTIKAVGTLFL